jgi:hypothetical protein
LNRAAATISVQDSYGTLSRSLASFGSNTAACHQRLSCVTAQDGKMSTAFGTFAQNVHGVSMPSSSTGAANRLSADATQAGSDFRKLSQSTSVAQYQQVVTTSNLQGLLTQIETEYQGLLTSLTR